MKTPSNQSQSLTLKTKSLKKLPWILASHAFKFIIIFILLDILLGGLLFEEYVVLPEAKAPEQVENNIQFEYNTYQNVLKEWEAKTQTPPEPQDKSNINPFI